MLEQWANIEIGKGETVRSRFIYEGQPLWDLVISDLIWNFLYLVDELILAEWILDTEKPREVILFSTDHLVESLFKSLCRKKGIPLIIHESRYRQWWARYRRSHWTQRLTTWKGRKFHLWLPRGSLAYVSMLRVAWHGIKGRLRISGRGVKKGPADVLYFTDWIQERIGNPEFDRFLRRGQDARIKIQVIEWFFSRRNRKDEKPDHPVDCFESYISFHSLWKMWKAHRRLRRIWKELEKSPLFQNGIAYRSCPLWPIARWPLGDVVHWCMPATVSGYETIRKLIRTRKPAILILPEKQSRIYCAIVAAARAAGVTTVSMPGNTTGHMNEEPMGKFNLTDWKLVEGEQVRQWFTASGFPPHRIYVIGYPYERRFKEESRGTICRKYGIDPEKKVAVLITSPVTEINRRDDKHEYVRAVYEAMRHFPETEFIVKLHPAEKENLERRMAFSLNLQNIKFLQHEDIYEILFISEFIIFQQSIVGHEAVAMNKLLIQVNLSPSENDVVPCAEMGAALGVYTKEAMVPTIQKILTDETTRQRLAEGRKKYRRACLEPVDGPASDRLMAIIQGNLP